MSKKFDYFQAFIAFSEKACEAADLLGEYFHHFSAAQIDETMNRIHQVEHEADGIKHTVTERLNREFVPPIEREDILSLVAQLDDVVDCIDEVIRKLGMYRVKALRPDVLPLTDLLSEACRKLHDISVAFADFKRSKTIGDALIEVNRIESEADTLHYEAVKRLFATCADAKETMIWQRIYDTLEDCFDSCEHTAEVVESAILKNS